MSYTYTLAPGLDALLSKLKKKDPILFESVTKKILQVVEKPELYKTLVHMGGKYKRVHVGSFVLLFTIEENNVAFLALKHHDDAYRR